LWKESGPFRTACGEPFAVFSSQAQRGFMSTDEKERFAPRLHTQADVEQMWRTLMTPLGWRTRSLWFVLVAPDDVPVPQVCEIGDLPEEIDPGDHATAAQLWRDLLADVLPGGRVALLLSRPGCGGPHAGDRLIAEGTYAACRAAGVPLEVMHLATDDALHPLPADTVLGRSA
jgi:hypothetical protein